MTPPTAEERELHALRERVWRRALETRLLAATMRRASEHGLRQVAAQATRDALRAARRGRPKVVPIR
jgi:hypothetical protein